MFIADTGNHRIRKVDPDGVISTVAGSGPIGGFAGDGGPALSARLLLPQGLTVDGTGNLFIADNANHRVRRMTASGIISTVAGGGAESGLFGMIGGFAGDGGPAAASRLHSPLDVAIDSQGSLFIADSSNHRIRRVSPDGVISTVAGVGIPGYGADGVPAVQAMVPSPAGVAVDASGSLYIADSLHRVRRISPAGVIETKAGKGFASFSGDGGPAASAQIFNPQGVAVNVNGELFIADQANERIRKVTADGRIHTIAGAGIRFFGGDGGAAVWAYLAAPSAVAADIAGNLFIVDTGNNRIRKVAADGTITTVAGGGAEGFAGDGGPSVMAALRGPQSVAVDSAGNLYIADTGNNRIRKVTIDGNIQTVAGSGAAGFAGDGGPATSAAFDTPQSVVLDMAGNLFVADRFNHRIRRVTPSGVVTTVAGNGTAGFAGDGGPAESAMLFGPGSVAVDGSGNLFIADTGNGRIRRVSSAGVIDTIAEIQSNNLTVDAAGRLFVVSGDRILTLTPAGPVTFMLAERGGAAWRSSGAPAPAQVGYGRIEPDPGVAPAGLAIIEFRQGGVLVSETSVPASSLIRSGRIYAEMTESLRTGIAIANPNSEPAAVSFFFTDSAGDFGHGALTIPPQAQIAAFLNEPSFGSFDWGQRGNSWSGAFTFSSTVRVSTIAIRGRTNERGEFLVASLPVSDLDVEAASEAAVLPHFAEGGGWITEIALVNPTDGALSGAVQFRSPDGVEALVHANGHISGSFPYSIPARSSLKLQTAGTAASIQTGYVRIVPVPGGPVPSAVIIFSFRNNGITVTEAALAAAPVGTAYRIYAEGGVSIRTGIAIANTSSNPANITMELYELDGSPMGVASPFTVPAQGQRALFINEIAGFGTVRPAFQGVLRLTSTSPVSLTGIRGQPNERGDFLIAALPPVNEDAVPSAGLYFPHIVDSGGYSMQFILLGGAGSAGSGSIGFFSQSGEVWNLGLR